jgi:ferritin-like protein
MFEGFFVYHSIVFNDKYLTGDFEMADIVHLDVPLFIRLLELAREEIKQDADIHDIAQKVIELSKDGPIDMSDYDNIVGFMKDQGSSSPDKTDEQTDELDRIKQLGGIQ